MYAHVDVTQIIIDTIDDGVLSLKLYLLGFYGSLLLHGIRHPASHPRQKH